jgi:undecaprenyl diphosphate synthase
LSRRFLTTFAAFLKLKQKISPEKLPKHIAIIMDGNGRWAKGKSLPRVVGHEYGVRTVQAITEAAGEMGIEYLTLYTFSTENWNRPKFEVSALMNLLVRTIRKELKTLIDKNVKLETMGDIHALPPDCVKQLLEAKEATKQNTGITVILALNYSSRWDLVQAVRRIASEVKEGQIKIEDINEKLISEELSSGSFPEPELIIRTSGEYRISNFMLWELAYAEFHFSPVFWPDFSKEDFYQAILDYQNRERRFGKTSEQIIEK